MRALIYVAVPTGRAVREPTLIVRVLPLTSGHATEVFLEIVKAPLSVVEPLAAAWAPATHFQDALGARAAQSLYPALPRTISLEPLSCIGS